MRNSLHVVGIIKNSSFSFYYYKFKITNTTSQVFAVYHEKLSLEAIIYLENFGRNFKEISAGMKFDVVLLVMSANFIAFGREENLVEIVVRAKQFFHSGCVFLLQYQEAGKYRKFNCFPCGIRQLA
jgi:hypothetical protein